MSDNGFRQRMLDKTDEELLAIVQTDRRNYQQGALQDVEYILQERGIPFTKPEGAEASLPAIVNYNYWPAVVGIIMVMTAIGGVYVQADQGTAMAVNVFITLLFRVIVVVWVHDLCLRYNLKKSLWITLGVIFGGWSLIAVNFAIATYQTPVNPDVTLFEELKHEDELPDDHV